MHHFRDWLAPASLAVCCIAIPCMLLTGVAHPAAPEDIRKIDDSASPTVSSSPTVSRSPDPVARQALPCAANSLADSAWVSFGCGRLKVHNYGSLGTTEDHDFEWGCTPSPGEDPIYSGSFVLAADSNELGVVVRSAIYANRLFVPNTAPDAGECGFDTWFNTQLGWIREGGCPGSPAPVAGDIVASSYSDTLDPPAMGMPTAAGVTLIQTVVSTSADPYGDFILFRWDIINRDGVEKGPWHAGTYVDWDIASGANQGQYSDLYNGYFIWSPGTPTFACGMLDPDQPSRYSSADPAIRSPYRIAIWDLLFCCEWDYCPCITWPNLPGMSFFWWKLVHSLPLRETQDTDDPSGVLINPPITLHPYQSAAIHQAMFFVDATSNDPAIIEANAVALAHRAARWAGFARGDVNDDGLVDLADVCWLHAGLPIYPDEYSGDVNTDGSVDTADIAYLMEYVSGNGPGPLGEWRFQVPPLGP